MSDYPFITTLSSLERGADFSTIAVLSKVDIRKSDRAGEFLHLEFSDRSGSFTAKLFSNHQQFAMVRSQNAGAIVHVTGRVDHFNNAFSPQVLAIDLITGEKADQFIERLQRISPVLLTDLREKLDRAIDSIQSNEIRSAVRAVLQKVGPAFETSPAARQVHHGYRHGLLTHTVAMVELADSILPLYDRLPLRRDLIIAAIILHDCCKTFEYSQGLVAETTPHGLLSSHISDVHCLWTQTALAAAVPNNIVLEIAHILLAHHQCGEWGSPVPPRTFEAWFVHKVDDFDARMAMLENALIEHPDATVIPKKAFMDAIVLPAALTTS